MCDPVTATYALAAVTAYGSYQQGVTAKKTGKYNTRVLENEAVRTRNKGVTEENKHREKVQQLVSKQRAELGASGVDIGSGSPLQLQENSYLMGEVDSLRIRENYQDKADSIGDRASLIGAQADQSFKDGQIGAVTAIGSAYASQQAVNSKWYNSKSTASTANM